MRMPLNVRMRKRTLCDGAFSLATELWTTGFVVCLGSHGGSWMMLPQLLWRKATLGWLKNSLNRISQKKLWLLSSSLSEKGCVKETWAGVSLWADARTVCRGFCWKPISTMAPIWPCDIIKERAAWGCRAAAHDSGHYDTRKAPVSNAERRGSSALLEGFLTFCCTKVKRESLATNSGKTADFFC